MKRKLINALATASFLNKTVFYTELGTTCKRKCLLSTEEVQAGSYGDKVGKLNFFPENDIYDNYEQKIAF